MKYLNYYTSAGKALGESRYQDAFPSMIHNTIHKLLEDKRPVRKNWPWNTKFSCPPPKNNPNHITKQKNHQNMKQSTRLICSKMNLIYLQIWQNGIEDVIS